MVKSHKTEGLTNVGRGAFENVAPDSVILSYEIYLAHTNKKEFEL